MPLVILSVIILAYCKLHVNIVVELVLNAVEFE